MSNYLEEMLEGLVPENQIAWFTELETYLQEQGVYDYHSNLEYVFSMIDDMELVTTVDRIETIYITQLAELLKSYGITYEGNSSRHVYLLLDMMGNLLDSPTAHEVEDGESNLSVIAGWLEEFRPSEVTEWVFEEITYVDWVIFDKMMETLNQQAEQYDEYESLPPFVKERFESFIHFDGSLAEAELDEGSSFVELDELILPEELLAGMSPKGKALELVCFLMTTKAPTDSFEPWLRNYIESDTQDNRIEFMNRANELLHDLNDTLMLNGGVQDEAN